MASDVSSAEDGMLCDIREAPHISHARSEGWLEKVHRGHRKEAGASCLEPGPSRNWTASPGLVVGDAESEALGRATRDGRWGAPGAGEGRLLALLIAAFRTCDKVGLMPHARHGGRGVCAFAAAGSKLTGTGFEKLQMVQTQCAVVTDGGSGRGRFVLSLRTGEAASVLEGDTACDIARLWREDRFSGFGTRVILAEDFKNPA